MRHHRATPDQQLEQSQSSSSAAGPSFSSTQRRSSKSPGPPMNSQDISTSTTHPAGERTASPTGLGLSTQRPSPSPTPTPKSRRQTTPGEKQLFSTGPFSFTSRRSSGASGASRTATRSATWSTTDSRRLSGTVHHQGRHANDWLFGGFSIRDQLTRLWSNDSSISEASEDAQRRRTET